MLLVEGIILINKTKNKTSRDMVNELNHIFNMKKIGHTGTLDPIATGVLVMCCGKYTKLVDKLSCLTKEYIAQIKIGIKTDTEDITGNILKNKNCDVKKYDINRVLNSLVGSYNQVVPIYSAKSVNGKRLYEYARNNESVVLPTNVVNVYEIELIEYENDIITFRCVVEKGCYIRSLIQTICDQLHIIGTMNNLVRTKQGSYLINDSYTIEDIKNNNFKVLYAKDLLNIETYSITEDEYKKVINGNKLTLNTDKDNIILTYNDKELAIYKKENDLYRPDIMLI